MGPAFLVVVSSTFPIAAAMQVSETRCRIRVDVSFVGLGFFFWVLLAVSEDEWFFFCDGRGWSRRFGGR